MDDCKNTKPARKSGMGEGTPHGNIILRIISFFARLISVPKCVICGELLCDEGEICPDCLEIWKKARLMRCPLCGKTASGCHSRPLSLNSADTLGERALLSLAFLGKSDSTDPRDEAVRRIVYSVKRNPNRAPARFCARELSEKLLRLLLEEKYKPDEWTLTYPPRCSAEKRRYGFDQGRRLARYISAYTGIPFEESFERKGGTVQKSLNTVERRRNAEGSLSLSKSCSPAGKKYIIVDDVVTTGATACVCASLLKAGGAAQVFPVSIARTRAKKRKVKRRPADKPWFARPQRH